jgi:hypothetical protein
MDNIFYNAKNEVNSKREELVCFQKLPESDAFVAAHAACIAIVEKLLANVCTHMHSNRP